MPRVFLDPATTSSCSTTAGLRARLAGLQLLVSVLPRVAHRADRPALQGCRLRPDRRLDRHPNVIIAIAWALLLNPVNGLVNVFLRDILGLTGRGPINVYTLPGLFFVQGISLVPITLLLISAAFRAIDASLEDAATASGAPFLAIMRRITLPLLTPALLAALVYQFVGVVESFDIPLIIGLRGRMPVLSTQIYVSVQPPGACRTTAWRAPTASSCWRSPSVPLLVLQPDHRPERALRHDHRPRLPAAPCRPGAMAAPALTFSILGFSSISFVIPALALLLGEHPAVLRDPQRRVDRADDVQGLRDLFGNPTFNKAIVNTIDPRPDGRRR